MTDLETPLLGEPPSRSPSSTALAGIVLGKILMLALAALLMLPLWPPYLLLRLFLPRPPILVSTARLRYCLRQILTAQPEAPGLRPGARVALLLALLTREAMAPLWGLAWMLDELLYGRALRRVAVVAPLFEISAARSGSTQIAHYLEDDPGICAPNSLMFLFPYLWAWKLLPATVGRLVTRDQVRAWMSGTLPPDFVQRHEGDAFRTDTFERPFFHYMHAADLMICLGSRVFIEDFSVEKVGPTTAEEWADFLHYLDAIGRKTLLFAAPEGGRRLMIKGHFLAVAEDLARIYPDARFLTVVRSPEKRIQSVLNFHRAQPVDPAVGALPWAWVVTHALTVEPLYCDAEMAWFTAAEGTRRTVVRFDDYVRDLEGTLRTVYRECLGVAELPPHVPRTHAARERSNYRVDRSLEQLGVDVPALSARLAAYRAWCRGAPPGT